MARLENRVCIVTGGAQGVGLGMAHALAQEGACVVVANRSRETGERAADSIREASRNSGGEGHFVETDVAEETSVRTLVLGVVERFGRLDGLINNATPTGGTSRLDSMQTEDVERYIRVNYYAAFWSMQAAFPAMRTAGFGRVINLASLNGVNAHRYTMMYNASKEALRALTRTAAAEWARYGITCNVICPAAESDSWQAFRKFDPDGASRILDANPSGRMGDPEADIGPLAVFLASEESRYITGNTIHADGGGHINGVPWFPDMPESSP